MTLQKYLFPFIFILCLGTVGCSSGIKTLDEYNKWLNEKDNGCIKTKTISGISVDVKYQPPSYVVLKQLNTRKGIKVQSKDSLLTIQNKLLTFLITLGPDKELSKNKKAGSVMYEGLADQAEYNDRVLRMNFFMEQYISLYIDGAKKQPVLALVENLYELSDSRTFVLVFSPESINDDLLKGKEYVFEYDDPFFNLGKVQMTFSGDQLASARDINIAWQ